MDKQSKRLLILSGLALVSIVIYMTYGAKGSWSFVLPFRGTKLIGLLLVAVSISTATVLFQTITQNRILTPSIMGFDALYVLILTGAIYGIGTRSFLQLPNTLVFAVNAGVTMLGALVLFTIVLECTRGDLVRLVLVGIILGTLFNSLSSFFGRVLDPSEYAIVQSRSFARFTMIDRDLLWICAPVFGLTLIAIWRLRFRLDTLSLGRDAAVNLGENPKQLQRITLLLISLLVAVSTALVGPATFFGLLVVSLAHLITPNYRHSVLLLSAALMAVIVLVGGQAMMERVFALQTPLAVIIDFAGGLIFLFLLIRGLKR